MIQFFKNINHQTIEVDRPENGTWVNLLPPLRQQEFAQLSEELDIPLDYLTDSPISTNGPVLTKRKMSS